MTLVIRELRCRHCGAPKQVEANAYVVLCDYCDSFMTVDTRLYFDPEQVGRITSDAIRRAMNPTEAEARFQRLGLALNDALQNQDRDAYRAVASEYYALMPSIHPETVPERDRQGARLIQWIRDSTRNAELWSFDPTLRKASHEAAKILGLLSSAKEPLDVARRYLRAQADAQRAWQDHPESPPNASGVDPDQLAEESLRGALAGFASFLPSSVIQRIRVEVLGDAISTKRSCTSCGHPLEADTRVCPACGARYEVHSEDPQLQSWRASLAALRAAGQEGLTLVYAALQTTLLALTDDGLPRADQVRSFLLDEFTPQEIVEAIDTLTLAYGEDPARLALLETIRSNVT
ncbi:MAG: zinc ribbon domain-containing protein [Myxococcota bacterium]